MMQSHHVPADYSEHLPALVPGGLSDLRVVRSYSMMVYEAATLRHGADADV
jgi:hypothetical protein